MKHQQSGLRQISDVNEIMPDHQDSTETLQSNGDSMNKDVEGNDGDDTETEPEILSEVEGLDESDLNETKDKDNDNDETDLEESEQTPKKVNGKVINFNLVISHFNFGKFDVL